jgi:hypothetical protein
MEGRFMVAQRLFGLGVVIALLLLVSDWSGSARAADDKEANAILDKAIQALGGAEKLSKVKAATWKGRGTINFGGGDSEFTNKTTVQGLDHSRGEFEGEFGGNKIKGVTVLAGNKGWRKIGDMEAAFDKDEVANARRTAYLQVIPITLVALKDKPFTVKVAKEKKVADKPAVGLEITGPDGKPFTLYFDKESGLLVEQVARVAGFMGAGEVDQVTTFSDYKEMGGIKKATKIKATRDGAKFLEQEITDFRVLDKVDPKTFEEPK